MSGRALDPQTEHETRGRAVGVRLEKVVRRFGEVTVLDGIDLTVRPGDFVALIGPSGCGKTTLLRLVGGIEQPDAGSLRFTDASGAGVPSARAGMSYCFQEPRLLPWRSVLRNVELPLELAGVPAGERRDRALGSLEAMRLAEAAHLPPRALSGGMRMRASMARAIVTKPRLLLLDEPFGALDEVTRQELDEELRRLWEREGCTALLVTHSIPEAVYLAERVVVLSPRPARIELDRRVDPGERTPGLRLSDPFNDEVRVASVSLHRAMGRARGEVRE